MSTPPPPPPHGGVPKGSGLPPGKYDIFVIPEHSAGGGFLYLPSMQPNVNSFAAGFASALILVVLFQSMAPAFRAWWDGFQGLGNMGLTMLLIGVGFGAWSLGRIQQQQPKNFKGGSDSSEGRTGRGGFGGANTKSGPETGPPPPPPHGNEAPPPPPHHESPPPPPPPREDGPHTSWQQDPPPQSSPQPEPRPPPRPQPPPPPQTPPQTPSPKPRAQPQPQPSPQAHTKTQTPPPSKGSWEKAREEMKKREGERRAKEAEQRRREDAARRLAELRAKDAKERQEREKERERREKEANDKKNRLDAERRAKELGEKLELERRERERLEKEAREAREKEENRKKELQEREERRKKATQIREEMRRKEAEEARAREEVKKKEEEEKRAEQEAAQAERKGSSYAYSGVGEKMSMWPNGRPPAPAEPTAGSTASQNPPPSTCSSSQRKPAYSGVSTGTSYRPYDKAKQPRRKKSESSLGSESSWAQSHTTARTTPPGSARGPYSTTDPDKIVISAVYLFMNQYAKTPASQLISGVGSVTDGLILRITTEGLFIDDDVRGVPQREWDVKAWTLKQVETGEWKSKGLRVLRATIRDQEGKRYIVVIDESEAWKLANGLQRLKRGAQAQIRQLAVNSMSSSDARGTLESLGWA